MCLCIYIYFYVLHYSLVCAFHFFILLLKVSAISITKESFHNTTKGAHCMAMKTKGANNKSALSKEYLKVRQSEMKDPV